MKKFRVVVNPFGNAYSVERDLGRGAWVPVIRWLSPDVAEAWERRLKLKGGRKS